MPGNPLPQNRFDRLFDSVGDGTGTTNMATTADEYFLTVPATITAYYFVRLLIICKDAGSKIDKYGGLDALATGIVITAHDSDDSVLHTYTPVPVKYWGQWGLIAGVDAPVLNSTGSDVSIIRWTLERAGQQTKLTAGQYMKFNVQDTLVGIEEHYVQAQGYIGT